jgi:hypothetical protein
LPFAAGLNAASLCVQQSSWVRFRRKRSLCKEITSRHHFLSSVRLHRSCGSFNRERGRSGCVSSNLRRKIRSQRA